MYLCVKYAAFSLRYTHLSVFSNFLKSSVYVALLLASASTATLANEGKYFKADGSRTNDLEAAAESWRTPEFVQNHTLGDIKAEYAYAYGITGKGIGIGIVDSGVLTEHPQLAGQITPLKIEGTYGADGYRYEREKAGTSSWKKGDNFSVPGYYDPRINDAHGTATAGGIVARRDGKDMHGIAFDAHLYSVNTGGTDRTLAGPSVDYEYFRKAYSAASSNGIRAVNSSWGRRPSILQKYTKSPKMAQVYTHFSGEKTFVDAMAEAARQYGTIQIRSNGYQNKNNPNIPASLPYFRPEIEKSWIAVTGVDQDDQPRFNRCGVAKYWCMAGPAALPYTTSVKRNGNVLDRGPSAPGDKIAPTILSGYNGPTVAAAHVTGSLALVMQRFPYLENSQARDVLLTTATQRTGNGNSGVPDTTFGWGIPDLRKAMAGPGQFLDRFNVQMEAGVNDIWANDISDAALIQREREERAEVASWASRKAELQGRLKLVPDAKIASDQLISEIPRAKVLLKAVLVANMEDGFSEDKLKAALKQVFAHSAARGLLNLFEKATPKWGDYYSELSEFDNFINDRSDEALADAIINAVRNNSLEVNEPYATEINLNDNIRIPHLVAKLGDPAAYLGGLTKLGDGQLTLTGKNSYRGDTLINGGELVIGRTGSITSSAFVNAGGLFTVEGTAATIAVNANGRLNVAATGTTGDIGITGGHAVVNGKSGRINVNEAGAVSGTGILGSLAVQSGGIVSPGNSVGALKVAGDAVFEKDSIFNIEIKPDRSAADQLAVSGAAKLLGGVVNVHLENDTALLPDDISESLFLKSFDILTAGKGVQGRFSDVWPHYNYITPVLDYSAPDKVVLGFDFAPEIKTTKTEELMLQLSQLAAEQKPLASEEAKHPAPALREKNQVAKDEAQQPVAVEPEQEPLADEDAKHPAPVLPAKRRVAGEEAQQRATLLAAVETEKKRLEAALLQARIDGFLSPEFLAAGVQTRNRKSVWNGIQSLGMGSNPMLEQVMHSTTGNPLNFDALSGEIHATLAGVLADDGHFIADAATARLRNAFGGVAGKAQSVTTPPVHGPEGKKAKTCEVFGDIEPAAANTAFWGEAYGSWQHAAGNGNAAAYSRETGGLVTGMDGIVAQDWRLGILAGYGQTSLHGNGKASASNYQVGIYGGTKIDALGLRFGVNLARHEIETRRTADFGNLSNEHKASYHGNSVQLFGELGYAIDTPYAALEPFAAARHAHLETKGFEEDGKISGLTGKSTGTDLTVTTLGLRASQTFTLNDSMALTARGMLGWHHAFGDVTPQSRLAFAGGKGFTVEGAGIAKDAAAVEAGLDLRIGPAASIGIAYSGQFSPRGSGNAIKADFSLGF
jgi:outer membrane autotransporter protein